MNRKHILVIISILMLLFSVSIILICYYCIPRISYTYDAITDSYQVDTVFGNAESYHIESTIKNKPVTKIRSKAFMNKTNLVRIKLSENLKEIERLAFLNCINLEEINLETVEVIGRNAFENCRSIKSVQLTLPNISGGVFMGCTSLETVTMEQTKSIGSYAFAYTAIETITIKETTISVGVDAFYQCERLKKIIVLSEILQSNEYLNSLDIVEFQGN
ncbi:MAG: leucine-rich repeat domain-containing protein [Anaeroplasmataceae bacterium]|nr:leucine-rich repeat domain-containing protein [Anaeroplasmataceae bacterium]